MRKKVLLTVLSSLWTTGLVWGQEQVCVPQFVDGGLGPLRWQTTLVLHNQEQNQAQVRLHFMTSDGLPMEGVMLRERLGRGSRATAGPGGQLDVRPMNGRSTRSYRSEGEGPCRVGYVCLESQNQVRAHAMLHLFDGAGNLVSETGIIPGQRFRRAAFFADQTEGKGVGIAFLNPSPNLGATCTLELFEENGVTPLGVLEVELGPRAQIARFLFELFPELLTGEVGFVQISCDRELCALALQLRGLQMLQISVFFVTNGPWPSLISTPFQKCGHVCWERDECQIECDDELILQHRGGATKKWRLSRPNPQPPSARRVAGRRRPFLRCGSSTIQSIACIADAWNWTESRSQQRYSDLCSEVPTQLGRMHPVLQQTVDELNYPG